jgi:propanol-preferring alcohol dehydrogenase
MKALQYTAIGKPPEIREVATPVPGPGGVLVRTAAAGVCHSDQYTMDLTAEEYGFGFPLTLGHEGAGVVAGFGAGAPGFGIKEGDAVAVYGAWGCGYCRTCATGAENYCPNAGALKIGWPGFDAPGFMAEYLLVPSPRHLVPLGGLDPVANVPLTDAGLTPYHAIKPSLPKLVPGSTAVVIGAGGLGHLAIQMLRALTAAQVIALDIGEEKLAFAREVGAHATFTSDPSSVEAVRDLTGGSGAQAVFNFVGIQATADLAAKLAGSSADIVMVGLGPGAIPVGLDTVPSGTSVRTPVWGTRSDLMDVLDLARSGAIKVEIEQLALDEGAQAYERMRAHALRGRAVLVP